MANVIEIVFKGKNVVGGAVKGVLGGFKKIGGAIASMQGALVALGGAATFTKIIKSSSELESALANVSTLVDTNKVNMDALKKSVLGLSSTVNKMPVELVEGLYQTISAGAKPGKESLLILESSAKLATAGLTTTASAVDIMTTAINAYGLSAEDATRVSDVLFKTVEQGKTTVGALASNLGLAIPTAAALGISLEQLSAGVATLTKGGFSTDVAISSLNSAFASLLTNADKFKDAGVDIIKIAGEEGMAGVFREVKEVTGGNIEKLQELIPEQRALKAVLALTGNQFEEYNRILGVVEDSTGATETAFQKQTRTLSESFKGLKISINKTLIKLGDAFTPITKEMIQKLSATVPEVEGFIFTIGKLFSKLPEITNLVVTTMKNMFTRFFTDDSLLNTFLSNFKKFGKALFLDFGLIMQGLANLVIKVSSIIWAPLGAGFRVIGSNLRRAWNITFQALIADATASLIKYVNFTNKLLPKAFEIDTSSLTNFLDVVWQSTVAPALTMEQAWKESGAVVQSLFSTLGVDAEILGDSFEGAFNTAKTAAGTLGESEEIILLKESLSSLFTKAREEAQNFVMDTEVVSEASTLLAEGIATNIEQVTAKSEASLTAVQTKSLTFSQMFKKDWLQTQKDLTTGWQRVSQISVKVMGDAVSNISNGLASVAIDGKKLGNVLKDVFKNVARSAISSLIQMGIQWVLSRVISAGVIQSETAQRMGSLAAETYGGAFASSVGVPGIGPIIAPGIAAGATATMLAGASVAGATGAALGATIGAPMLADGGIVTEPTLAVIGEAGPEAVIPLKDGGIGGSITIEKLELFPNVTAGETLLSIPRDLLARWVERELLPVFEDLTRAGKFGNVSA